MTTKIPAELSSTPGIADSSNATAITIDSSENVGIGSTSPDSHLHLESSGATSFRIRTTSSSSEPQIIMIDGAGDYFSMQKVDRGMTFKPQGAEELRIDADGLKFNGDTAADNALDDYETGTFTPTVVSGITSVSYSSQDGYYTKVGDTIMISMRVQLSSGTLQSSLLSFAGLPEAARASTYGAGFVSYTSSFANQNVNFYVNPGSTQVSVYKQIGTNFAGNDLVNVAFDLRLMLAYLT